MWLRGSTAMLIRGKATFYSVLSKQITNAPFLGLVLLQGKGSGLADATEEEPVRISGSIA